MPDVDIVAVVAHADIAAAQRSAEKYGAAQVTTTVDEAVRADVDILDVATHPAFRLAAVRAAATAGVAVVNLEKPYALTRSDADAMSALAEEHGCRIVVNHQKPFLPAFAAAEAAVRRGDLGPLRFIRATCQGSPADQGTHLTDLVLRLLDLSAAGLPDRLSVTAAATGPQPEPGSVPAGALVADVAAGPARVLLTMGSAGWTVLPGGHPLQQFGLEVSGEDGWLEAGMCTRFRGVSYSGRHREQFATSWEEHFREAQTQHCARLLRLVDDPTAGHPSALARARVGLDILLAARDSALSHASVDVAVDVPAWRASWPSEMRSSTPA
jgi:predicted dehydrogenase